MYICRSCGQTYSEPVKFCGKCGSDSFDTPQQAYATQQQYNTYSNPTPAPSYSYAPPAPAGQSKAPAIVGMIFGISSLMFVIYQMFFTFMMLDIEGDEEAMIFFWIYSIFVLPFMIVGLVMSFKDCGSLRGMSITGRITSFITAGIWLLTFFVCLANL